MAFKDKIYTIADLISETSLIRKGGDKVVFTNGCFDILHLGHVTYLEEAKKMGDYLIVGINSDASVTKLKGDSRPIQNETSRTGIIAALESVDAVILFNEDTPLHLIEQLVPDVLVKGGDWPINEIVGQNIVINNGGTVKALSFIEGHSTTNIEQKIKQS